MTKTCMILNAILLIAVYEQRLKQNYESFEGFHRTSSRIYMLPAESRRGMYT
jgi:hypothetical protein